MISSSQTSAPSSAVIPTTFFLPEIHLYESLRVIAITAVVISVVHQITFRSLKAMNKTDAFKTSYQITNFIVNLSFGIYGFYVCFVLHEHEQGHRVDSDNSLAYAKLSNEGLADHVFGYDQYYIFGALQVGYNMWSLPVGILYINESLPMIIHHIFVIVICSLTATSHYGFRLHAPFLLGMFEMSSVPLAVCNYFKDHREWTMKNYGAVFDVFKLVFSLMFFGFRIVLGSPHMYHITKASYWAWNSFGANHYGEITVGAAGSGIDYILKMWIAVVFFGQCFMAGLQYYWAFLIIKGLARSFLPKEKNTLKKE